MSEVFTPDAVATDPQALTDQELQNRLQIQIVDMSHGVQENARDHAAEYINQQTTQGNVFQRVVKKIWYGNIARDYIQLREQRNARNEIIETGNLYAPQDGNQGQHEQAARAVVDRFVEGFVHEGENQQELSSLERGSELQNSLKSLVASFASGELDHENLVEEKTRLLNEYGKSVQAENRKKGLLFADNILEVAHNAKAAFDHGLGLDRIDAALVAKQAEARMGVRTEAKLNTAERVFDKLYESKAGSLLNETTLGAVAATAVTVGSLATRKAASAAGIFLSAGAGVAVVAGVRESLHIKQDRRTHMREMAEGAESSIIQNSKRRESLEKTRYETVAAQELIDSLRTHANSGTHDVDSLRSAVDAVTSARARISLSDTEAVDLIHFSNKTTVEQERGELDRSIAEARASVQRILAEAEDATLTEAGIETRDANVLFEERAAQAMEILSGDMSQHDKAFRKLQAKRVASMAAVAFISSEAVGLAIQEIKGAVSGDLQSVFEQQTDGHERRTLLAALLRHDGSTHAAAAPAGHDFVNVSEHTKVDVPKGYHLSEHEGSWQLENAQGHVVENVTFDKDGQFSEATQQHLAEKGFHFSSQSEVIQDKDTVASHHVARTAQDYLKAHPDKFTKVHREFWYDNDTPTHYELNELALQWGQSGAGMDEHGNFVFDISNMSADGSSHNGISPDVQHLIREGKVALALSMGKDSQSHVVMLHFNEQGQVIIPKGSFEAQSLFTAEGGQAHFRGAYAEVVQLGAKQHGVQSMRAFATFVGENHAGKINDTVSQLVHHQHTEVTNVLTAPPSPILHELPTEIPPVLPIYGRTGLATPGYENNVVPYGYRPPEYYVQSAERMALEDRLGLAPFAPELELDPNAKIDANPTTKRYLQSLRPAYRSTLARLSRDLERQPHAAHPKVVVMIPAAAHQEGKNIYRTLSQYASQEGVDTQEFEVVVFANNPKGTRRDITIKEVQRFQLEHPDLNVRIIEKKLEKEEANIGWVRKAVTDTMLGDLLKRGVDLNEVMLVSNDADSEWIDPRYLRTVIDRAAANPDSDGFLGYIDWGYDAYKAHPQMLAATRLMQMVDSYIRITRHEVGSSGANFAFRPSLYAAVGGYQQGTSMGEDVVLGRMIKSARAGGNGRRPIAFLGRSSEVNTSARRALDKLLKDGGAPAQQWDDEFSAYDSLRTKDFELKNFDFSDESSVRELVSSCQDMFNNTLVAYGRLLHTETTPSYRTGRLTMYDSETIRQLNRMFWIIGAKVAWQPDGTVRITDGSEMVENLKRWQTKH